MPVNLAHIALSLIPDEELADVRAELEPWMPVIEVVMAELADCPDGVLVEVEDGDETVSIVKRGRKLVIDIDTRDESVHVSIPIRGVARLIDLSPDVLCPAHGSPALTGARAALEQALIRGVDS